MDKIPTLFVRDPAANFKRLTRDYAEGLSAEIVSALRPTAKWDGTCVKWEGGQLFPRYHEAFRPMALPFDNLHRDALAVAQPSEGDGTYELCGPKVQSNPHGFPTFTFVKHGALTLEGVPVDWDGLALYLATCPYEGVVWWDSTKPVCKIKRRDFGHPWPIGR